MRKELKDSIEALVKSSVKDFESENSLNPKRIVLFSSIKLKNPTLVFNYTQNRLYNQQYIIDKKIPVEIFTWYREDRHKRGGDYTIDVGAFLNGKLKDSAYLDF